MHKALFNKAELTYQLFGEVLPRGRPPGRSAGRLREGPSHQGRRSPAPLQPGPRRRASKNSRPRPWRSWKPTSPSIYTSQGTGPYQLLAEVLDALGQRGQLRRAAGKTPRRRPGTTCRWPTTWPNNIARPASSTRPSRFIWRWSRATSRARRPKLSGLVDIYRRQKNAARLLDVLGDMAGSGTAGARRTEQSAGRRRRRRPGRRGRSPPPA